MRFRPAASPGARIAALARDDKWFLGGLDGVVWAPPFPRWLHRPGFWDPVHLLQHEVGPGFSVAFVHPDGRENPLRSATSSPSGRELIPGNWQPGRLETTWSDERGIPVEERREVLSGGILESSWQIPRGFGGHLVGFTAQPADAAEGTDPTEGGVGWTRAVTDRRGQQLAVRMELAGSVSPAWRSIMSSEGRGDPEWRHSPFAEGGGSSSGSGESAQPDAAPGVAGKRLDSHGDAHRSGWIWIAVALPLAEIADDEPPTIRLTLRPEGAQPRRAASRFLKHQADELPVPNRNLLDAPD